MAFGAISWLIYFIAVHAGFASIILMNEAVEGVGWDWEMVDRLWGPVSGSVGAVLLLQAIALFHGHRVPIWRSWPVVAGAVIGFGMVESMLRLTLSSQVATQMLTAAFWFSCWQAVVGVLCFRSVRATLEQERLENGLSLHLRTFLTGPVVQLLGLLASLIALASLVRSELA
ncbi:MAG: hypothetical protein AAGN46_13915 [Acidobacteriota bacterium]